MPGSLDTMLEGMRGMGDSFSKAGNSFQGAGELAAQQDERARKRKAAEDLAAARTEVSGLLSPLAQAAQAEDFDQAAFVRDSNAIREKVMASGDMDMLKALESIENVARERARDARATAKATASEVKQNKRDAKKDAKDEIDLQFKIQDRHDGNADTKNTAIRRAAFDTIDKLADKPEEERTPTDDISAIFTFMRLNDPTSTVREGEFATAENAKGVDEKVRNLYNSVVKGQRLTESQYQNFRNTAETVYRGQLEAQKKVDERTLSQLRDAGIDPSKVLTRRAEDDLKALDDKAKKRATKKDAATNVPARAEDDGKPPAKVVGKAAMDKIFEMNREKWAAGLQAVEARQGRPLTPQERNAFIAEKLKVTGLLYDPNMP